MECPTCGSGDILWPQNCEECYLQGCEFCNVGGICDDCDEDRLTNTDDNADLLDEERF